MIDKLVAAEGVNCGVYWEQLLRLNYCTLRDGGTNFVDVGGNLGAHAICFIDDINTAKLKRW